MPVGGLVVQFGRDLAGGRFKDIPFELKGRGNQHARYLYKSIVNAYYAVNHIIVRQTCTVFGSQLNARFRWMVSQGYDLI